MPTFAEVMTTLGEGERPALLLGNGFSQAWDRQIFSYHSLYEKADFGDRDDTLRALFERFDTYDFETIMKHLVGSEIVLGAYGADPQLLAHLQADQQALKDALIEAISDGHPDRPHAVTPEQYTAVRMFLARFGSIFTLNYDLLMYWARNQGELEPLRYDTDDGFREYNRWRGYGTRQAVHFLHGGLHIYDEAPFVKKHAYTAFGATIIDQVRQNLDAGRFPVFVSEPTHERKRSRIEHHPYLNYCFQALRGVTGTLVIFGHSIHENDRHIFDQLRRSSIRRVFVSVYGDLNSDANLRTMANARTFLAAPLRRIEFFDAASAPIWAELVAPDQRDPA